MPSKNTHFECVLCKAVFDRNFNLKRHIGAKHKDFEKNKPTANTSLPTANTSLPTANTSLPTANCDDLETHQCGKCYKLFTRKWSLNKHFESCKGEINKFQCEYCLTNFRQDNSRFRHYKICSIKKELSPTEGDKIVNNSGNIHQLVNGNQNITNNIIVVYNPTGNTPFSTDHLTCEDLKKIIKLASSRLDNRALEEYSKQIFSHPENRCIKKTNIKLAHSQVHTGDNKWKLQLDKNIYPQLATDLANNMSDYVDKKREAFKKDMYVRLRDFVDSMCDAGYINTEPTNREKEIQKEYKTFMDGLKLIIYENTKSILT